MTSIWHVALEPIEQRYTAQWFHGIPNIINEEIEKRGMDWKVRTVVGDSVPDDTTDGAFLVHVAKVCSFSIQGCHMDHMRQHEQ